MYLLDLSHTSHTRARTGIQRVARAIHAELSPSNQTTAVTWDPYARQWRELNAAERGNLQSKSPSSKRGAHWPWSSRLQGSWSRRFSSSQPLPKTDGIIIPEIFSTSVHRAFSQLPPQLPRFALFHDAIALKLPELTPPGTIARFPGYLQELLDCTGIAAVSEDSRQALLDYWHWLGIKQPPPVETIPLGIDESKLILDHSNTSDTPQILCVGSIEGRKNHLLLLDACEKLWRENRVFNLRLIGMANAKTGRKALQRIRELQSAGRPLQYDGAVDEPTLQNAYRECTFTVYPSLMEGFGLPVLESLIRGKPCICSSRGALGESARPGGALMLDTLTPESLGHAINQLLLNPTKRAELSAAALQRTYRSWSQYTSDLLTWIKTLG